MDWRYWFCFFFALSMCFILILLLSLVLYFGVDTLIAVMKGGATPTHIHIDAAFSLLQSIFCTGLIGYLLRQVAGKEEIIVIDD